MKSVRHLFADATALLEDLHGLAVEGQAHGLSPDIARVLVHDLRSGIERLDRIAMSIGLSLGDQLP